MIVNDIRRTLPEKSMSSFYCSRIQLFNYKQEDLFLSHKLHTVALKVQNICFCLRVQILSVDALSLAAVRSPFFLVTFLIEI